MAVKRKKNKQSVTKHDHQKKIPPSSQRNYWFYLIVATFGLLMTITVAYLCSIGTPNKSNLMDTKPSVVKKSPAPSKDVMETAQRYSYAGDLTALKKLIRFYEPFNWTQAQYGVEPSSASTLLHVALRGRHDSIYKSSPAASPSGDHEGILSYLLYELKWNASYGCPIYYAVHYRNMRALKLFLNTSTIGESLGCLTVMDSLGITALHVAAKSKASGFARLYSQLFDSNGIVHTPSADIVSLLGLKHMAPSQKTARILTVQELNEVIFHSDIEMTLKRSRQLTVKQLSQVLDSKNNTILHVAACAGRFELVKTLLKHVSDTNDDPNVKNIFQQTPMNLAKLCGHTNIVRLLKDFRLIADDGVTLGALQSDGKDSLAEFERLIWNKHYMNSGWNENADKVKSRLDHLNNSHTLCSEILPVVWEPSGEVMSHYTPLMIHSPNMETMKWSAWKNWRKKDLIKRYGDLQFEVSNIPYEDLYFTASKTTRLTLKDYVRTFDLGNERPLYLFDGKSLNRLPELAADFVVPKWMDSSAVYLKQFILGGRNSGSPPHFHDHAVNFLIYGVKEWYFWKPSDSFFAFTHVMDWKKHYSLEPHIKCLQVPGDVIYVPQNWGHAVINMEDSVGIALEFW